MNAIQFIKEHGVEKAREVVEGAPVGVSLLEYIPICSGFSYIKIIDGIRYCFNPGANNWFVDNFKAEISFQFKDLKRLVESIDHIGDVNEMVDCEILDYPEDYTSPNCKKFDERVK